MLLPHRGNVQSFSQASPFVVLPSSHGSADALNTPSPHAGAVQSESQLAELPPVSQASLASTMLLPQVGSVQLFSQLSPFVVLPASHGSAEGLKIPSPRARPVQSESRLAEFPPVSQASLASTILLPQVGNVQLFSQLSPLFVLPSSHGSAAE